MNSSAYNIIFNDDENARDEFSARQFFQKKSSDNSDVTNSQDSYVQNVLRQNKPIIRYNHDIKKRVFMDVTNKNLTNENNSSSFVTLKRQCLETLPNEVAEKKAKISQIEKRGDAMAYFVPYRINYFTKSDITEDKEPDSLSELNNIYTESAFIGALSVPASGYNKKYTNRITVAEPWNCEKMLKIEPNSAVWSAMIETAILETRVLSSPCRKACSPTEQFSLTEKLQYKSNCLIESYHSSLGHVESFSNAIFIDAVNRLSRKNPNHSHCYMSESINISHFHDLYLEKLECNQLFDFMPQNKELTGVILGGFINNLFELSRLVYLPSEVIHIAVDYIYQYLSRVHDVPLNDLNLVALGAIWVASKFEGLQYHNDICRFANCTIHQLKHAELRLLMVIDFNLTKPSAINFRNRYIIIEPSTSIISHLSSFILDMTLHCYTVMILPASKRAAAALWLSRLIEMFEDLRFHDQLSNGDSDELRSRMETVWPDHYHKLTGYHHSEVSQLAIRMHVIVIAFLCHEQKKKSSVNACYNKYSNDNYKNLTGSYAKFTSRVVYFGAELYCNLNNLSISDWLDKKEYETLQITVCEPKPSYHRYYSSGTSLHSHSHSSEQEANSCPELSSRPLIRNASALAIAEFADKASLLKLDSGYATCSNLTSDSL